MGLAGQTSELYDMSHEILQKKAVNISFEIEPSPENQTEANCAHTSLTSPPQILTNQEELR